MEDLNSLRRYHNFRHVKVGKILQKKYDQRIIESTDRKFYSAWVTDELLELVEIPKYDYSNSLISGSWIAINQPGKTLLYHTDRHTEEIIEGVHEVHYLSIPFILYRTSDGYFCTEVADKKMILGKYSEVKVIEYCYNILEYQAKADNFTIHAKIDVRLKKTIFEKICENLDD